jgi:transposase
MSRVGRPRADDRVVLNGILYVLTTGCRWMDMPLEYGSYKTLGRGLRSGRMKGYGIVYSGRYHPLGIVSVDSSTVEAKKGES